MLCEAASRKSNAGLAQGGVQQRISASLVETCFSRGIVESQNCLDSFGLLASIGFSHAKRTDQYHRRSARSQQEQCQSGCYRGFNLAQKLSLRSSNGTAGRSSGMFPPETFGKCFWLRFDLISVIVLAGMRRGTGQHKRGRRKSGGRCRWLSGRERPGVLRRQRKQEHKMACMTGSNQAHASKSSGSKHEPGVGTASGARWMGVNCTHCQSAIEFNLPWPMAGLSQAVMDGP
ncbi:hypothetical protein VTI74DRAFT_6059 [Chaetomium olivicolor]